MQQKAGRRLCGKRLKKGCQAVLPGALALLCSTRQNHAPQVGSVHAVKLLCSRVFCGHHTRVYPSPTKVHEARYFWPQQSTPVPKQRIRRQQRGHYLWTTTETRRKHDREKEMAERKAETQATLVPAFVYTGRNGAWRQGGLESGTTILRYHRRHAPVRVRTTKCDYRARSCPCS